jgi:type II secretory pathway component PulF
LNYEVKYYYFPDIFEETERGAIRSAEAVGRLENMLLKIAKNLERRHSLIMQLTSALIYPVAVFGSLVIAVIIMLTFVIPRMEELFRESSATLPQITRFLLKTSLWLSNSWWLLAIALIFAIIIFHMYTHSENGRFAWDFRKLRIPFVGPILRKIFVMRFTDTLGVLMESGLPINHSLKYVAGSIGNEVYRVKTFEALGSVQEGKKLSQSLAQAPFLFPETVTNMIAVGEHAANLGEMCQKIGSHYLHEINHTLKNATTVLGPVLILFIGATVAFFALAILSPIFSLTQAVI